MHYVYILQSELKPDRHYVGHTTDPDRRLLEHNSGKSVHANKFKPWRLTISIRFDDRAKAIQFE